MLCKERRRLSLSITQPLLNGAGKAYNSHLIVLAQIDAQSPRDHVSKDLQSLLLEVYQAYWDLHLQRALLLQKRKLYERGVEICRKLEGRREIDARGRPAGPRQGRRRQPLRSRRPPGNRAARTPTPNCGR